MADCPRGPSSLSAKHGQAPGGMKKPRKLLHPAVISWDGGMTIVLPIALQTENNMREHWRCRYKRRARQRDTVKLWWPKYLLPKKLPLNVTITRVAPRFLDPTDNLPGSAKAVIDEVAAQLRVDDADPRVTWAVKQERNAPHTYGVIIRIEKREGKCSKI